MPPLGRLNIEGSSKELIDFIKAKIADQFVARQTMTNRWIVVFRRRGDTICKLKTKRGEEREFLRLNGVQKWMEKVGVKKFTVEL